MTHPLVPSAASRSGKKKELARTESDNYTIARFLRGHPHVYHFAGYGETKAGKTCLLAVMGMREREPNPMGYTCLRHRWLEGVLPPPGDAVGWDLRDDAVAAFYYGGIKLGAAEDDIRAGRRPKGTDKQPPYLLLYTFTTKRKGAFQTQMIDYSGELTQAELLNADENAALLELHLETMDAIFILLPAPWPGEESAPMPRLTGKLLESFDRLHQKKKEGGKWNTPVALIINKWDRRSRPGLTPQERHAELTALLEHDPPPFHVAARNQIESCVGPENFRIFVASAFGEHQTEAITDADAHGEELPVLRHQLNSYGLEDPFVWAAIRRDAIDFAAYQEATRSTTHWLHYLNFTRPGTPWKWRSMAQRLTQQLPAGTDEHTAVKKGIFKHVLTGVIRASVLAGVVLALLLVGEAGVDSWHFRMAQSVFNDPEATSKEQQWAEQWLLSYATSAAFWHFPYQMVVSKTQAQAILDERKYEREGKVWQAVTQAGGPEKIQLVEGYIAAYPQGRYVEEALLIIASAESGRKQGQNEHALSRLEAFFNAALAKGNRNEGAARNLLDQVDQLPPFLAAETLELRKRRLDLHHKVSEHLVTLAGDQRAEKNRQNKAFLDKMQQRYLAATTPEVIKTLDEEWYSGMPYPEAATEEIKTERVKVETLRGERKLEVIKRKEWGDFVTQYSTALDTKDVAKAARLLDGQAAKTAEVEALQKNFSSQALQILTKLQREQRESENWLPAIQILDDALGNAAVYRLLDKATREKIAGQKKEIRTAWGRPLYDAARKGRTEKDMKRYLKAGADQRMAGYVRAYLDYLDRMASPNKITITLERIAWGEWWSDYKNKLRVYLGDSDKPIIRDDEVVSTSKGESKNVGTKTEDLTPNSTVTLEIRLWNEEGNAWFQTRPAGSTQYKGKLLNLHEKWLALKDWDGGQSKGAWVRFRVSGIPTEPDLPLWKED